MCWESNRSYLFSFSTSLGRHCLHLKKQLQSVEIPEPCIYFPDVRTCEKPSSQDGEENIDFPNFNLIRGKKKAGECTQTKGLQRSPIPSCLDIITVCVSDHGLSWFSSRCFTWTTRFLCIYILNRSMCWSLHRWHFDLTLYLYNKKHDRWLRTTWGKAQPDGLVLNKQGKKLSLDRWKRGGKVHTGSYSKRGYLSQECWK